MTESQLTTMRSAPEVAMRILLLACVTGVAQGVERQTVVSWLHEKGLWKAATPNEVAFLSSPSPSARDQANFSWLAEAVFVLGWALHLVDDLPEPKEQASIAGVLDQMPAPGDPVDAFISSAMLRPAEEIMESREAAEDAHAYCRVAQANGEVEPNGFDIDVAQERHRALNWLARYEEDLDWDDVTTDT